MSKKKQNKGAWASHVRAVRKRTTEKLKAWHFNHKNDEAYRVKRAEGSRRHLEQVYRDAELGRMAREVLNGIGDILARLAALKTAANCGKRTTTSEGGEA